MGFLQINLLFIKMTLKQYFRISCKMPCTFTLSIKNLFLSKMTICNYCFSNIVLINHNGLEQN